MDREARTELPQPIPGDMKEPVSNAFSDLNFGESDRIGIGAAQKAERLLDN
jgi:hypothetical protein